MHEVHYTALLQCAHMFGGVLVNGFVYYVHCSNTSAGRLGRLGVWKRYDSLVQYHVLSLDLLTCESRVLFQELFATELI